MSTAPSPSARADAPAGLIQQLAADYWAWRAAEQPQTDDDIPRLLRPAGWRPDWSPRAVAAYREAIDDFERRWAAIPLPALAGADEEQRAVIVDHALMGSAIARARFELDVTRSWQRDPGFGVDQSVGVYFTLLRAPVGFDDERTSTVLSALRDIPRVLDQALGNLAGNAAAEPTALTVRTLRGAAGMGAPDAVQASADALAGHVAPHRAADVRAAGRAAATAIADYARGLEELTTTPWRPIGSDGLQTFLDQIALNPAGADELLRVGDLEYERAVAFSVIASRGHRATAGRTDPRAPLPATADAIARQHRQEAELRRFYETHDLLSQPASLRRYLLADMPDYLVPLQWLGVTDEIEWQLAGVRDAVSYQPDSGGELGFFDDAIARNPMTGLIHEGCHSQQLALSALNPDPVRRHYYDSGANEGIAYYNEEMLTAAGLFADDPDAQETIHAFLRLRALRVGVDIGLALGRLSIADAAATLARSVPMDDYTAHWEASFFAKTPGQGMTYQVGKTQILAFLAEVAGEPGFSLRGFHDRLWRNGNVPIALQRYEWTGRTEALGGIRV